jgi:hypothetical protein
MRLRPQAPHSPLPPGITRTASLRASLIRRYVTETGTIVNQDVTHTFRHLVVPNKSQL